MSYNINGIILPVNIDVNNKYRIVHSYGNIKALNGKFSIDRNGVAINFVPKSVVFYDGYIEVDFGSYFIYQTDVIYYSFGSYEYTSEDLYKVSDFSGKIFISKTSDFSAETVITGGIHPPNVIVYSDNITFNVFSNEKNPHFYWNRPEQEISEIIGYYYNFSQDANHIVFTNDLFVNADEVTIPVPTSGVWYFHIRAINSFGNLSKQTTTVCVKYNNIPTVPVNLMVNNSPEYIGSTSMNEFTWDESHDSDSDTFQYFLELYNSDVSDSLMYSVVLNENRFVFPTEENEFFKTGIYRYRVRSFDQYEYSEWSNFCVFNIKSLVNDAFSGSVYAAHMPPVPLITCNVEDSVWTPQNIITFIWTSENDRVAIGKYIYKFELYKYFEDGEYEEDFEVYDNGEDLNNRKRYNLDLFTGSSIYVLSVRAQGVSGLITEPAYYYIKYNHPPTVPNIPLNVNGINSISRTGYVGSNYHNVFSWGRSSDEDYDIVYYELQISKDISFNNIFYEKTYMTDDKRASYSFHNGTMRYENSSPGSFYSYDEIKSVTNWEVGPIEDTSSNPINAEYLSGSLLNVKRVGYLYIDNPGEYHFGIWCDDLAAFRIDNRTYFSTITEYWTTTYCFSTHLNKGYHFIENFCNNNGGGSGFSRLYWKTPTNNNWNYIPKDVLFYCVDASGNLIEEPNIYKYFHDLIDASDSNSESEQELSENFEISFNVNYDNSYNGLYYWRVRAYDRKQYSTWSFTGKFKLNTPPSVPTNLSITY